MIFIMAVIGAVTRLTESGLSMVRWHAVKDMLLPLDQAAWDHQFALYKQSPEFKELNSGMDLAAFKNIYFWEWLHRLWGRLIGLVYAVPFVYFAARRRIPRWLMPRLVFFLALGGLQGFIGWYMVKSGLIDEPRVSHYRLALHLGTAFVIFALLWRQALEIVYPRLSAPTPLFPATLKTHGIIAIVIASITILWGVFVAGLDAGLIYNEFPLMGGQVVPPEGFFLSPAWRNFVDNHAMVQFTHRMLAVTTFLIVVAYAVRGLNMAWPRRVRRNAVLILIMMIVQVSLGVATLLSGVMIPLAAAHQAGALTVLALLLWQDWEMRRYPLAAPAIPV